eukprot:scaffold110724_cov45-Phaeocystis_antarctica.AAC.1
MPPTPSAPASHSLRVRPFYTQALPAYPWPLLHPGTTSVSLALSTPRHYQRIPGVINTCVGYTQGNVEKPSYEQA